MIASIMLHASIDNSLPSDSSIQEITALLTDVEKSARMQIAHVRIGNDLCQQEKNFLVERRKIVKKRLEELSGKSIDKIPNIAVIGSGGGCRAMLSIVGMLSGLEHTGLFDTLTYVVGLSGSTWGLTHWIMQDKLSTDAKLNKLIAMTMHGFKTATDHDITLIRKSILERAISHWPEGYSLSFFKFLFSHPSFEPVGLTDIFGGYLANRLFEDFDNEKQKVVLSGLTSKVSKGQVPLPIYTAVRGETPRSEWYEITPYEVGGAWLNAYVPTWGFGRVFHRGSSIDFAPELSFGFMLGIFGSGFTVSLGELFRETLYRMRQKTPALLLPAYDIITSALKDLRLAKTKVHNFTLDMPGMQLSNARFISLLDAGVDPGFILPYPPISGERPERKADLIIILDASLDRQIISPLDRVIDYAKSHKLKLPSIPYGFNFYNQTCTVFKNEADPSVPVVIYMPMYNNEAVLAEYLKDPQFARYSILNGFNVAACEKTTCETLKFKYPREDATRLVRLSEFNVITNVEKLKKEIIAVTEKLSK
jgi:phospholipase A2